METTFYILATIAIVSSLLPYFPSQHWFFRSFDFLRIQVTVIQIVAALVGWIFIDDRNYYFWFFQATLSAFILKNVFRLIPFTQLYPKQKKPKISTPKSAVTLLCINVEKDNEKYQNLIELVKRVNPDILLTIESDKKWEDALQEIEADFPYKQKEPLDNTYGMHFYSKTKVYSVNTYFHVSDDVPSIEAEMETDDGDRFVFIGVHPPPPSPTEEETSKERDGELLVVAKRVRKKNQSVIVTGDFNNVAWAKSSKLFQKTSQLLDARIGRGFIPTFHARYKLFRFPIDLLFHSPEVYIEELKTLESIGSDHFPLFCKFYIYPRVHENATSSPSLEEDDRDEIEEMIIEGKKE